MKNTKVEMNGIGIIKNHKMRIQQKEKQDTHQGTSIKRYT